VIKEQKTIEESGKEAAPADDGENKNTFSELVYKGDFEKV